MWASELWTNVSAHDASLEPEEIQEVRPLIAGQLIRPTSWCMAARACRLKAGPPADHVLVRAT